MREVAYDAEQNPGEQIALFEKELGAAREARVDLLSPVWFYSAERSLERARNERDGGGEARDMLRFTAEGREQLTRANQFARVSEKELEGVLKKRAEAVKARQAAKGAGAGRLAELQREFAKVDGQLQATTRALEDGDMEEVTANRPKLLAQYARLETLGLKKEKLDEARRLVDQAIEEGARHYAPKSLAAAEQEVRAGEAIITNNPNQEADMDQKAEEALFYSNRALKLTREAKTFSEMKPEDLVLWIENTLVSVGDEVGVGDLRDEKFDEQVLVLKGAAKDLKTGEEATPKR